MLYANLTDLIQERELILVANDSRSCQEGREDLWHTRRSLLTHQKVQEGADENSTVKAIGLPLDVGDKGMGSPVVNVAQPQAVRHHRLPLHFLLQPRSEVTLGAGEQKSKRKK